MENGETITLYMEDANGEGWSPKQTSIKVFDKHYFKRWGGSYPTGFCPGDDVDDPRNGSITPSTFYTDLEAVRLLDSNGDVVVNDLSALQITADVAYKAEVHTPKYPVTVTDTEFDIANGQYGLKYRGEFVEESKWTFGRTEKYPLEIYVEQKEGYIAVFHFDSADGEVIAEGDEINQYLQDFVIDKEINIFITYREEQR